MGTLEKNIVIPPDRIFPFKAGDDIPVVYLTEIEVSKMINRALPTLRNDRFANRGIPYRKIGRSVRYLLSEVYDFMESRKIETVPLEAA